MRTVIYNFQVGTYLNGLAIDSSGNYIVTQSSSDELSKVTPAGERTVIYQFSAGSWPNGVNIDSSGNNIVAESEADIISMVTPDGVRTAIYTFSDGTGPCDVECTTITYTPISTDEQEPYSTTLILIGIVSIVAVGAIFAVYFMKRKR